MASPVAAVKYFLAHVLGSVLAATIICGVDAMTKASLENLSPFAVLSIGGVFAVFGFFPAVILGAPAVKFLLSSNYKPLSRLAFLTVGGALVGTFVTWSLLRDAGMGGIVGASIGLMQGLAFYSHRSLPSDHATT